MKYVLTKQFGGGKIVFSNCFGGTKNAFIDCLKATQRTWRGRWRSQLGRRKLQMSPKCPDIIQPSFPGKTRTVPSPRDSAKRNDFEHLVHLASDFLKFRHFSWKYGGDY